MTDIVQIMCLHIIVSKSCTNELQDLNVKNVFHELLSINVYTTG